MQRYDPADRNDREALAAAIIALMEVSEFTEIHIPGTNERVFSRVVPHTDDKISLCVYTSIEGNACRRSGKDAIRVVAVYATLDGQSRGLVKDKRVNRTGTIDAIRGRVLSRMRSMREATKDLPYCHCGAPQFISKAGNTVCADLCWKRSQRPRGGYSSHYASPSQSETPTAPTGPAAPAPW